MPSIGPGVHETLQPPRTFQIAFQERRLGNLRIRGQSLAQIGRDERSAIGPRPRLLDSFINQLSMLSGSDIDEFNGGLCGGSQRPQGVHDRGRCVERLNKGKASVIEQLRHN